MSDFLPNKDAMFDGRILWPCTIVPSRYGGTYSGGVWLAFPQEYEAVDSNVHGGDVECGEYFRENEDEPIGRGNSPQEAYEDLLRRLRELGELKEG